MNKKLLVIACGIIVVVGFSLGIYGHNSKEAEK